MIYDNYLTPIKTLKYLVIQYLYLKRVRLHVRLKCILLR
jgi:hypothetical protein